MKISPIIKSGNYFMINGERISNTAIIFGTVFATKALQIVVQTE